MTTYRPVSLAVFLTTVLFAPGAFTFAAEDRALERKLLRAARGIGLAGDPIVLRKEIAKRRKYHKETMEREWKKYTKEYIREIPAKEINHKNKSEVKAQVMYRQGGRWRYTIGRGKAENHLPRTNKGITECWVKHSLNKTYTLGYEVSNSPGIPSKQYYSHGKEIRWRKCSWDERLRKWVLIGDKQRVEVVRGYARTLHRKARAAKSGAAGGPDQIQMKKARSYAERSLSLRRDRKLDEKTRKFRIESDTQNAYWRLVMAYDDDILQSSIASHEESFQKLAWGR